MILTIRPATQGEVGWMSQHLRSEDVQEVETASGRPVTEVVPLSFGVSRECYTIRLATPDGKIDEHPSALFGVANARQEGRGVMWLLATEAIRRGALSVIREAPKWLDHFNRLYPRGIYNMVDTRNSLHIRWLALTGFTFGDAFLWNGVPFVYAERLCVTL